MGRLFWKFFLSLWLAFLVAGIGVGTAVWFRHESWQAKLNANVAQPKLIEDKHASGLLSLAENALALGDIGGLRDFLTTLQETDLPQVYAVDDQDHELLQRHLSDELLKQARSMLSESSFSSVHQISTQSGEKYILFVLFREHKFRRNPPPAPLFELGRQFTPPFIRFPDNNIFSALDTVNNQIPPPPPRPEFNAEHYRRHEFHGHEPPSPLIPILISTLASFVFSFFMAWYFSKPIQRLKTAFADLANGKFDTRIGDLMGKRRDELADLGREFDHMAAQIDSLVHAQQRLLHDVSHELRSPLARIQAAIGLTQQQPEKLNATLDRIERESQRISDLVGELLVLSQLEAGVAVFDKQTFELSGFLQNIVDDINFEASQYKVTVEFKNIDNTMAYGCVELLHRAIENVLRNALQHCKTNGQVNVNAQFDKDKRILVLCIDDQGPGVAELDLKAIFEPFFRSGKISRPNSIGLGLSIASKSIAAHGGQINAVNLPEEGLRVEIKIPFTT